MTTIDDARLQALLLGRRAIRRVAFPGQPDLEIGFRVLRDSEIDDCRFAASSYLEKRCKAANTTLADYIQIDPDVLDREHQRQVIWRSTFDPDAFDPKNPDASPPFFPNDKQVRELDSSLVACLWGLYVDLLDAVDPRIRLDEEQVKELVFALGKGPESAALLAGFTHATLASCLRSMAALLATSPTGSSSTSSS